MCVCMCVSYYTVQRHCTVLCHSKSLCYCVSFYAVVVIKFLAYVLKVTHFFVMCMILHINGIEFIYIYTHTRARARACAHVYITVTLFIPVHNGTIGEGVML